MTWQDYLAATQRLDQVRREAAEAVAAEAATLRAAREELPAVRARLALQQQRLAELSAMTNAPAAFIPTQVDVAAANRAVSGGPAVVLAALRQARSTVDVADAAIASGTPTRSFSLRPLRVYGPIAGALLLVQLYFAVAFHPDFKTGILLAPCDAVMSGFGFALGWLLTAPLLKTKDRAPALGALVCLLPMLLSIAIFIVR